MGGNPWQPRYIPRPLRCFLIYALAPAQRPSVRDQSHTLTTPLYGKVRNERSRDMPFRLSPLGTQPCNGASGAVSYRASRPRDVVVTQTLPCLFLPRRFRLMLSISVLDVSPGHGSFYHSHFRLTMPTPDTHRNSPSTTIRMITAS